MRRPPSSFKSSDTLDSIAENYQSSTTMKPIRRKSSQDLNIDLGIFQQDEQKQHQFQRQPRRASDGNRGDEIGPPIFLEVDFDDDDDDDNDLSVDDDIDESLVDLMDECTLGDECSWDRNDDDNDSNDSSDTSDDDSDSMYEHSHANDSRRILRRTIPTIARPNKLMNSDSFATHDSSKWSQCMTMMDSSSDAQHAPADLMSNINTSFSRNDSIHNRGAHVSSDSLPCSVVTMLSKTKKTNTRNGSFYSKNNGKNRRTMGASSSIKMNRSDSFSTIGSNMTAAQEAHPQRFLTPANSFTSKTAAAAGGVDNHDATNDDHVNNMTCDMAAMTTRDFPVVQPVRSTVDARKFQMANRTMFKLPFGSSSSDLSHMVTTTRGSSAGSRDIDNDDVASQASTITSSSSLSFLAQKKYQRPNVEQLSPFASPNPAVMTPSPKMSSPIRLPFRRSDSLMMQVPSLDHDNDNHQGDLLLGTLSSPSSPTSSPPPNTRFGGLRRKESIHRL
jgi:hypothetical protein